MTREQIEELIATLFSEHLARLKKLVEDNIVKAVAAKPLAPFVPPMQWIAARYSAGCTVRHRNGIFHAVRDTEGEPGVDPDGSWLPLVVGIASIDALIDGRTMSLVVSGSDGLRASLKHDLPIPIYRGVWDEARDYTAHDMVTQKGAIWHAHSDSKGLRPGTDEGAAAWKLAVKNGEKGGGQIVSSLRLSDDGDLTIADQSGEAHTVGSIKKLVAELLVKHGAMPRGDA
jgi:hypothetical protein